MPKRAPTHRPKRFGKSTKSASAVPVDRKRPSAHRRGYGRKWAKLRDAFAARHPLCAECFRAGVIKPMDDVDHIIPRARGGTDDSSNLQSLCSTCHSRKTAREDGGFGNAKRTTPSGPPEG